MQCKNYTWVTRGTKMRKKNCGTKIAEQKMVGTIGHWVLGTSSASAKRSAEPKCGTKIGGDSWTSGVGDHKWKCKKVS